MNFMSDKRKVLYGPLQLFVMGFPGNKFKGEIIPAIDEARDKGIIRLIDYLFVLKDSKGNIAKIEGTDLTKKENEQFYSVLGALVGLGAGGIKGAKAGAKAGAEYSKNDKGFLGKDIKDIVDKMPKNSSALLMLVENLWAKKIKQALVNAEGIMLAQGTLTPELLVEIGFSLTE